MKKSLFISATSIAAAVVLAGCASTSTGSSRSTGSMPGMDHPSSVVSTAPSASAAAGSHNAADTMFAQAMIPHHAQAISMSDTILKKQNIDPRVTALAEKIKAAQSPEIQTMTGWLKAWSESTAMAGDHSMGGMMSDDDMKKLDAARGAEASKLFLTQMVQHHRGAIAMAKDELAQGSNRNALNLAQSISTSQAAEIRTMNDLLASL